MGHGTSFPGYMCLALLSWAGSCQEGSEQERLSVDGSSPGKAAGCLSKATGLS